METRPTWRLSLLTEIATSDLRTVIFTPTGRDGHLIAGLLERQKMPCHIADSLAELCAYVRAGAGAAMISEEAFGANPLRRCSTS